MSLFNKISKSSLNNEENLIGVNLLSKEQKISLLGISCYLCSPIFIQEDKANDYYMILFAFTQMLGLNEKELLEVGKKQDASDIQQYVNNIRTIQKEKSLILFDATCQELIRLSDNKNFISIAYKRILMDIGYSSEESDAILDRVYFEDRDIEAYKPNNDSSSVSDIDIMVDYCSKQRQKVEDKIKELSTPMFDDMEDNEEEDSEYVTLKFLHNWKFTDFLKGRDYDIQIKETVNCETGDLEKSLILQDQSERHAYIRLLSYTNKLTISEFLEKKEDLFVGITEYGNFWLHDGRKVFYMEADYIY
jgi:hypothetical protein